MAANSSATASQSALNYYHDIMIIGHTGQGKSTTVDKLVIANPNRIAYQSQEEFSTDGRKITLQDLSIWTADQTRLEKEHIADHLKELIHARASSEPYTTINEQRGKKTSEEARTTDCEVYSNETTKVRVLDVPGFFDRESLTHGILDSGVIFRQEVAVMRKVLIAQTRLGLNFKKVLYFLPVRGPLNRAGSVVQQEMKTLMYYFGKSILGKLVLVATNQSRYSKLPGGDVFPEEEEIETRTNFEEILYLMNVFEKNAVPPFPLICISLGESCESILQKVKDALVTEPNSHLKFEDNVCRSCGYTVSIINGEKKVCYMGETDLLHYEQSKCHPMFILDSKWYHILLKEFLKYFTLGEYNLSLAEAFNLREFCISCGGEPGSTPCAEVGTKFELEDAESITVDHNITTRT